MVRLLKRRWFATGSLVIYTTVSILMFVSLNYPRHETKDRSIREKDHQETSKPQILLTVPVIPGLDFIDYIANKGETPNKTSEDNRENINYPPMKGSHCQFDGSLEDNMNKLKSMNFSASKYWMERLGFDRFLTDRTTSLPVLVTGANARFYGGLQGLIETVHTRLMTKYPSLKLIVYDLGFTEKQNIQLRKYCRCEVRRLPFGDLPDHVSTLGNFAFKPIILNYVFQEFGQVWWVDSSVRFISSDLERPLKYLKENGALFFTYGSVLNVALHTHRDTFQYFKEDPCPFMKFGEVEAGNVAFTNNEIGRLILNRWVSCALDRLCISPPGALSSCPNKRVMSESMIGSCHRFDQSVLSIILRRLYHKQNDYPDVEEPIRIIQVRRGESVSYFPKT